jgi:hypothetical protein
MEGHTFFDKLTAEQLQELILQATLALQRKTSHHNPPPIIHHGFWAPSPLMGSPPPTSAPSAAPATAAAAAAAAPWSKGVPEQVKQPAPAVITPTPGLLHVKPKKVVTRPASLTIMVTGIEPTDDYKIVWDELGDILYKGKCMPTNTYYEPNSNWATVKFSQERYAVKAFTVLQSEYGEGNVKYHIPEPKKTEDENGDKTAESVEDKVEVASQE